MNVDEELRNGRPTSTTTPKSRPAGKQHLNAAYLDYDGSYTPTAAD